MRYQSFARWNPKEVPTGALDAHNETTDEHATEGEAQGVVNLLKRIGFGGEGRFFPIEVGVRPVGNLRKCSDCGDTYTPAEETKLNGQPMGLCVPCAEDHLHPQCDGESMEDM